MSCKYAEVPIALLCFKENLDFFGNYLCRCGVSINPHLPLQVWQVFDELSGFSSSGAKRVLAEEILKEFMP